MRFCRSCGHPLGDATASPARFCPHCGQPTATADDWRTDTAERPRVVAPAPRTPPHAGEAPPPARFPLYADEYAGEHPHEHPEDQSGEQLADAPDGPPPAAPDWFSRAAAAEPEPDVSQVQYWDDRRSPVAWVVVSLAVLVLVVLGWWYLARAH